jgi:NADH:ubiquinone oxidoreductase subunit C
MEREVSEMFGVNYFFKKDLRKLLTDYSNIDNPLLKSYPTEGFNDIFYNFFEDQVIFSNNNSIEL